MKNFFKNEKLVNIPACYPDLAKWEKSADPSVRFENNYYTLQRLACLHDYEQMMNDAANNPDDEREARKILDEQLDGLRARYIADVELLFELQMSMQNIFLPWRVKITPAL